MAILEDSFESINTFFEQEPALDNSAWSYDGAGNPTTQETLTAKYNSAGQRSSTTSPARHIGSQIVNLKLFEGYDGDGQQVAETRETTVGSTTTQITTYKIRSSVLGGQIVVELTSTGAKQTGYVYAEDLSFE